MSTHDVAIPVTRWRARRGRPRLPTPASPASTPRGDAPLVSRVATADDGRLLAALVVRALRAAPGGRETPLAYPRRLELGASQVDAGQVILAERGDQVLGLAAIQGLADGDCELGALYVERDPWRTAVARLLVAHCADAARLRGASVLHVAGAPRAELFHRGCGFELVGPRPGDGGAAQWLRMPLDREPG